MQLTGQVLSHAPQLMQSVLIVYAILFPSHNYGFVPSLYHVCSKNQSLEKTFFSQKEKSAEMPIFLACRYSVDTKWKPCVYQERGPMYAKGNSRRQYLSGAGTRKPEHPPSPADIKGRKKKNRGSKSEENRQKIEKINVNTN